MDTKTLFEIVSYQKEQVIRHSEFLPESDYIKGFYEGVLYSFDFFLDTLKPFAE